MWSIKLNGGEGSLYQFKKHYSCCPQDTAVNKESYGSQNIAFEDVECYDRFFQLQVLIFDTHH